MQYKNIDIKYTVQLHFKQLSIGTLFYFFNGSVWIYFNKVSFHYAELVDSVNGMRAPFSLNELVYLYIINNILY
jgi:hypothetical protein